MDMAAIANDVYPKAKEFKTKAGALNSAAATFNGDATNVGKFQAAALALNEAGHALKEFAELLENVDSKVFEKLKTALVTAAGTFKTACGTTGGSDGFYYVASTLNNTNLKASSGTISDFGTAATNFGYADKPNDSTSAAYKFNTFDTESTSQTAPNFKSAAEVFQIATSDFNTAAEQIDSSKGGELSQAGIHTQFSGAATTFHTAANTLFTAIMNIIQTGG